MEKPIAGDYVKLTESPRADIPAPQYCKVVVAIETGIVANCYSTNLNTLCPTYLHRGYEVMPRKD